MSVAESGHHPPLLAEQGPCLVAGVPWYHLRLDGGTEFSGIIGTLEKRPKNRCTKRRHSEAKNRHWWCILCRSEIEAAIRVLLLQFSCWLLSISKFPYVEQITIYGSSR